MFAISVTLAASLGAHAAHADDEPNAREDKPPKKRSVPDYDGTGPPSNGANAGVWVARVLLSPLYFVSEYVIREPMDGLMNALEAHDRLNRIYDFFAFGPDHKIGFAPIGFVEFGFNPSVGIYGFWNDAFVANNAVHMHIEAWPTDWLAATFDDRYVFGNEHALEIRGSGVNRPDQVFYGTGPDSAQYHQSRYREARMDASAALDLHVWRSSRAKIWGGIRKVDLSDGHYGSDPSVSQEAGTGAIALPFGFNRGYTDPYGALDLTFDTRDPDDPRSGVRLEAHGDVGTDVDHGSAGWVHYGGVARAFWDVDGQRRILSLSAGASFADQLGSDPIPFTELVSLGGDKWMTGFFPGRLRDRSSAVAMLRYDWPIASWIDGTLQAVVGNVFDEHLDGFRLGRLRFSGAVGITTNAEVLGAFAGTGNQQQNVRQHYVSTGPRIEIVAGFGTDTFEQNATVQSFHISFGVPHSF